MDFLKKVSIATKIITIAAVLAAVFLFTSVSAILSVTEDILKEASFKELSTQTTADALRIEFALRRIGRTVFFLRDTPPIQGMIRAEKNSGFDTQGNSTEEQWKDRLATIFEAEMRVDSSFTQIRYIDEEGNERVRVNSDGTTVTRVPDVSLQNKADRDYFREAMRLSLEGLYVSEVELNREGDPPQIEEPYVPVIRYATPVFENTTGERKGIIIINISYDRLIGEFEFPYPEAEDFYILDHEGFFLTSTESEHLWGSPNNLDTGISLEDVFGEDARVFLDEENGIFETAELFSFSRIPTPTEGSYWVLVRSISTKTLFRPITSATRLISILGFLSFIVLFFAFLFAIRRLLHPLKELQEVTQKIGRGDFSQRIKVRSEDEIGQLALRINQMSKELEELYTGLEQKVKERTADLEEAQRIGKFGSFVWDLKTNEVHWSDEAFRIHGWEPSPDGVPPPLNEYMAIIHPKDRKAAEESITKALEKRGENEYVYRVPQKDGSDSYVQVKSNLTLDTDGKPKELKGTFQDITKEREITEAKTDFVSMVSHQLKTPVAQIKGYIANMLDGLTGPLTDKQKEYLKDMDRVATENGSLLDALLNVSRIERRVIVFEKEKVRVKDLLTDVIDPLQEKADKKDVLLERVGDTPEVFVTVDGAKTREALRNIVDNAIKFSPDGGTVQIAVSREEEQVAIRITDEGPGIDADVETELFEKDRIWVGKVKAAGAGLGLYLTKKFITLQGGTITFETSKNGTTFTITFPLKP